MNCRVDLWLAIGQWAEYTSLKRPVDEEMARSLAEHLKRNKTGVRIVEFETGKVIEEWQPNRS